jgi:hypothetical protein
MSETPAVSIFRVEKDSGFVWNVRTCLPNYVAYIPKDYNEKFHENFTSLNDLTFSLSCFSVLQFFIYWYTNFILLCTLTLWSLSVHMLHHVSWCSKCLATLHVCQPIMAIFLQHVTIFPDPINIGCYISAQQSGIGSCIFSMTPCHSSVPLFFPE